MKYRKPIFTLLFLMGFLTIGAQTRCDSVLISQDTNITVGNAVTLRAHNLFDYQWLPASAFNNPADSFQTVSPTATTTYYITGHYISDNVVTNGNFESGNTGFNSQYQYSTTVTQAGQWGWGIIWNAGTYTINSTSANVHSAFVNIPCVDHTTGSGNCMFVNGNETAGAEVWRENITVTPNTDYIFIAWVATLSSNSSSSGNALARLQFSINNQTIGNIFNSPSQTAVWERFYQVWNSGSNTSAIIRIINQNTEGGGGNDFALDDISFSPLYPCTDSVTVTVGVPLDALDDQVAACRGTSLTMRPLDNDIIDNWCGTVQPEIVTPPTHASAQVNGPNIDFTFDPTFTGTETMSYRICCSGRCDTAQITLTTSGKENEIFERACDHFVWNGQTYSSSGAYNRHFVSADGCDSTVTLYLTIDDCTVPVYFPSAISPSIADGHNDRLSLPDIAKPQMEEFKIRIFDRWGNIVFYSEDKDFVWDGTRNGKLLPNSVYVYELRYKTAFEEDYKKLKGTITVL
jgi:gliding motility-associated-like protein